MPVHRLLKNFKLLLTRAGKGLKALLFKEPKMKNKFLSGLRVVSLSLEFRRRCEVVLFSGYLRLLL
jgi:hypothetical protein